MFENLSNMSKSMKITIAVIVVIILSIVGVSIATLVMNNSYPIVIKNLEQYTKSLPSEDKKAIQIATKNFLESQKFTIPEDLYIRDNTYSESKENNELKSVSFIIDSDTLKQSYKISHVPVRFESTSVNPVIDCPELDKVKYEDSNCVGMYNSTKLLKEEQKNPISKILPIEIDEKGSPFGTRYSIYGYFDPSKNQKFVVNIADYTGGNYDAAIQQIVSRGFNPDDYEINYQDQSVFNNLPHVGKNSLGNQYKLSLTYTNEGKAHFNIINYSCGDRKKTEASSKKAAADWLKAYRINLNEFGNGIITLCQ